MTRLMCSFICSTGSSHASCSAMFVSVPISLTDTGLVAKRTAGPFLNRFIRYLVITERCFSSVFLTTYVVSDHLNHFICTLNIGFYGDLRTISPKLSSNIHHIGYTCSFNISCSGLLVFLCLGSFTDTALFARSRTASLSHSNHPPEIQK